MFFSCPLEVAKEETQNVDPEGSYSDVDIWSALDTAQCKAFVELLPGRLDHEVAAGGSAISKGTRQLLALARALCGLKCAETSITDVMIVRKRKIMVLDEASASLDTATDLGMSAQLNLPSLMSSSNPKCPSYRIQRRYYDCPCASDQHYQRHGPHRADGSRENSRGRHF